MLKSSLLLVLLLGLLTGCTQQTERLDDQTIEDRWIIETIKSRADIEVYSPDTDRDENVDYQTCPTCKGSGKEEHLGNTFDCSRCNGTGKIPVTGLQETIKSTETVTPIRALDNVDTTTFFQVPNEGVPKTRLIYFSLPPEDCVYCVHQSAELRRMKEKGWRIAATGSVHVETKDLRRDSRKYLGSDTVDHLIRINKYGSPLWAAVKDNNLVKVRFGLQTAEEVVSWYKTLTANI